MQYSGQECHLEEVTVRLFDVCGSQEVHHLFCDALILGHLLGSILKLEKSYERALMLHNWIMKNYMVDPNRI